MREGGRERERERAKVHRMVCIGMKCGGTKNERFAVHGARDARQCFQLLLFPLLPLLLLLLLLLPPPPPPLPSPPSPRRRHRRSWWYLFCQGAGTMLSHLFAKHRTQAVTSYARRRGTARHCPRYFPPNESCVCASRISFNCTGPAAAATAGKLPPSSVVECASSLSLRFFSRLASFPFSYEDVRSDLPCIYACPAFE